ncbi:MAG: AAA family ATPase, partial [Desulfobacterales bacterium]|nr:AAA family ATPase [Desulfobacterales bacterium]
IEVKSGPAGAMKSLHQFMAEKRLDFAVRCNINPPIVENIHVKTTLGDPVSYKLLSIPVYMAERVDELIDQADNA